MTATAADLAGIIHDRLTDLHDQSSYFDGEAAIEDVRLQVRDGDAVKVAMSDGRTFRVTVEEI